MGLPIDPTARFPFVLITDQDKPEATRPTLEFRYLAFDEFLQAEQAFSDSLNSKDLGQVRGVVEGLLVGWKNFPHPYAPASSGKVLSLADYWEIRDRLLSAMTLEEIDKKKSLSRLRSSSTPSANATAGQAIAATAQPSTPSTSPAPPATGSDGTDAAGAVAPGAGS